ncbi:hypothetical protein N9424_03330 [Gammaproteobacteria bacterium]|nr:hypothetical protein [Gammaproteobacteria bacterium]
MKIHLLVISKDMKDLEAEIEFLKTKVDTLETHLEELKKYYFTTRELDGCIIKYHSQRLDKLDNGEF